MNYQEVYFYIDSAYTNGLGWPTEQEGQAFDQEVVSLFTANGWELCPRELSAASNTVRKGQQQLYLHPMMLSGVILQDEIESIETLIQAATTFRHRSTSRFKEYVDMDDAAYLEYLHSRREEFIAAILERYKTKRSNLYRTSSYSESIGKQFMFLRVSDHHKSGNKAFIYAAELIEELIADGRLVAAKTKYGRGVRTATKKELVALQRRHIARTVLERAVENTYDDTRFLVGICSDPQGDFSQGLCAYQSRFFTKKQLTQSLRTSTQAEFVTIPGHDDDIIINPRLYVWKQSINESQRLPGCSDVDGFHHVLSKSNPHYDVYFHIDHEKKIITFACGGRRKTVPLVEHSGWSWKPTSKDLLCSWSDKLEQDFLDELCNPIAVTVGRKFLEIKDAV